MRKNTFMACNGPTNSPQQEVGEVKASMVDGFDTAVLAKLKRGDRNIYIAYTSHCRYKGKWHKGLHNRRCVEIAALYVP